MSRAFWRATRWPLALLIPVPLAAQVPPLPPRPPPPPGGNVGGNPNAPPHFPGKKPPVDGNMDGLLDYMAAVATDNYDEIDAPAVGYGNELLWEATKGEGTSRSDPSPSAMQPRTMRRTKAK